MLSILAIESAGKNEIVSEVVIPVAESDSSPKTMQNMNKCIREHKKISCTFMLVEHEGY